MNEIQMIKTQQLFPHPANPRKDLGDLTELTESLKKHGVMQNLTVYQFEDIYEPHYRVLIGHRRLQAAKNAGITELPCRVIDEPTMRTQLTIMLEENMQRNDLTIIEQAESFQMMLDLGGNVKDIAEKTGFSESTIYHRLNIAKLDRKTLKRVCEKENFQLTIKDFCALEAIDDLKERNRILSASKSSSDFQWKVQNAVQIQEREKNRKVVLQMLKEAGIPRLPKEKEERYWSLNYDVLKNFDLYKAPEKLNYKHKENDKDVYVLNITSVVYIIRLRKEKKAQKSAEDAEKTRIENRFKNASKIIKDEVREFLLSNPIPEGTAKEIQELFIETCKDFYVYSCSQVCAYISGSKNYYSEPEDVKKNTEAAMKAMSMRNLLYVNQAVLEPNLKYDNDRMKMRKLVESLKSYGFSLIPRDGFSENELSSVLDGSHEYLKK